MNYNNTDSTSSNTMELKRENNVFIRIDGRSKNQSIETKYKFRNIDGKEYNIYISPRKRAYVLIPAKSGNINKVLLPKEVMTKFLKNLKLIKIKFLRKKVELDNYSTPVERIVA